MLPEPHNTRILKLLLHFGHWHGLAKLRLHTDEMLDKLDELTTTLGNDLRVFKSTTCAAFETKELRKEASARRRRQTARTSVANATGASVPHQPPATVPMARKHREFNMNTYKTHSLGDYVETIRWLGTTDSYSTESVSCLSQHTVRMLMHFAKGELEHRNPKGRYKRTSKKNFKKQLVQIERRQARLRRIQKAAATGAYYKAADEQEPPLLHDPSTHHHIGLSENLPQHIGTFIREHIDYPGISVSNMLLLLPPA